MGMKKCKECKHECAGNAKSCPKCGYRFPGIIKIIFSTFFYTILAFIALGILIQITSPESYEVEEEEVLNEEVVRNSPWDSSVFQVEMYLDKILLDPNSYEPIDWYEVLKITDLIVNATQLEILKTAYGGASPTYYVRHTFRSKNTFGGYTIQDMSFWLDENGNVLGHYDNINQENNG